MLSKRKIMKTAYGIVIVVVLVVGLSSVLLAQGKKPVEVRKVSPEDNTVLEEWERITVDHDVLGVSASRLKQAKWNWQITVSAAEFAKTPPLEPRLQEGILSALKKVKGVKSVAHEDREVWLVQGESSGEDLVRACSAVVDDLADDIRKSLKSR
jgi:hypothetical protein